MAQDNRGSPADTPRSQSSDSIMAANSNMPIAIVGMSCRLAGTATSPDALWQMLVKGMSGWTQGINSRFKMDSFYHPATEMSGAFITKGLYLLKQDVSLFDNHFFNISPVEAKAIDPQQRLMLEVAYEAFENAGITAEALQSSNTGVYCAVSNHDYETMLSRDPEISPVYRFTGTGAAIAANRISYSFNLKGPSITLDTACSGSLVAVHEACKAIRSGEVKQALVGGTNLIIDPERVSVMSALQVLSSHGRCYTFDSRADGFGRGEGVAAIILKPLSDAVRDGDSIQAVIRGSAVNSDGRTPGLTMPSKDAQVNMMRKAYAEAGLDPRQTCYVEAHGTGTQVGDKIESAAIAETFCCDRSKSSVLYVGSVKTNVGHAENTAGLAGLLKAILVLQNRKIPSNLNFKTPNDKIHLDEWNIKVPQKLQAWPENQVCRASVNSFGYGGTNAHVILEAAEDYFMSNPEVYIQGVGTTGYSSRKSSKSTTASSPRSTTEEWVRIGATRPLELREKYSSAEKQQIFVLTHDNEDGIARLAADLKRYVQQNSPSDRTMLDSLAYTLSSRRSRFEFRVAVGASSTETLIDSLEKVAKGSTRSKKSLKSPKICFAFTGQGAQWACMGRELLNNYPIFANSIAAAEQHLSSFGADWVLSTELNKNSKESRINEATLSQPCCTAIQISLVDLLRSWGIQPHVVCGHSSGEVAAAYAAGFISAFDAMKISFYRGTSVALLKRQYPELEGRMLAVGLSVEKAKQFIAKVVSKSLGKVVVACINSPTSVTLSGDKSALALIQADLEFEGIFNRLLQVDVAYHSHHMEIIRKEYTSLLGGQEQIKSRRGVRMMSSVTGQEVHSKDMTNDYWAQNMVSTVRFSEALEGSLTLVSDKSSQPSANMILEIGPHSALAGPIKQTLKAIELDCSGVTYHSILLRNVDAVESAIGAAGELFARGADISFDAINNPCDTSDKRTLTNLPSYSWQHTASHWNEGRASSQYRFRQFPRHDLLGVASHDSLSTEPTWRNYIRRSELPWTRGHIVNDQVIFPASGHICMALEALRQTTINSGRGWKNIICRFREVVVERALLVPDNEVGVETFFTMRRYVTSSRELSSDWREFRVFSVSDKGEATEHCRGQVFAEHQGNVEEVEGLREKQIYESITRQGFEDAQRTCINPMDPEGLYKNLKSKGLDYTVPFANIIEVNTRDFGSFCRLTIPETKLSMPGGYQQPHVLHPATLDGVFQTAFPALMNTEDISTSYVLSSIDEMEISSSISSEPGTLLVAHTTVNPFGRQKQRADVYVSDPRLDEPSLIVIRGLGFTSTSGTTTSNEGGPNLYHQVEWSMDTANARKEDVDRICRVGLSEASAWERRETYDIFVENIIQEVLAVITVADEASMIPHHKQLLQWMRARKPQIPVKINPSLYEKVKSFGIDGIMLAHVSDNLVDILKGKVDPLTVLMKDDLLYRVYSTDYTDRCNLQLINYIRQLQFKNPQLRILEIGAGTASATIPILEALTTDSQGRRRKIAKLDKYVFTDISSGFFEKAKEKLENWGDLVEFKKLDIEVSLAEQGFKEGTFDLILAGNVIHATETISTTLNNVRKLLKPGGKLGLVEITQPHMIWPMIVGSLSGWWLGAADGRVDSPLLSAERWNKALLNTGFSGVDIELKDYESVYEHQVSVIISTATAEIKSRPAPTIQVVCNDEEKFIAEVFSSLVTKKDPTRKVRQTSLGNLDASDSICVVLLDVLVPFLKSCDHASFEKLKLMFAHAKDILWVTRGAAVESDDPEKALIHGLSRTLRSEDHSLNIVTLDLDPTAGSLGDMADQIYHIFEHSFGPQSSTTQLPEFEYAVRQGTVLIPRITENDEVEAYVQCSMGEREPQLESLAQPGRSFGLEIETPGLLETLYWTDSAAHSRKPAANEVRVEVNMVALNFKDLMNAMGQLEGLSTMLIECGGTVVEVGKDAAARFNVGDRVCAMAHDGLATTSNLAQHVVQRIPDGMSFEVASAILVSYSTALYALRDAGRLRKGESILIHSGAGALGQAAIALAKYLGAEQIFVTVGNSEKKKLVMENFGIPEENIFSSRGLSFGAGIQRQTNGKGVDVVLNSLSGEAARESQNCLARFGRFVEVGKKDLLSNARMEMQYLEKNATFTAVDLTMVAEYQPAHMQELLETVVDVIHTQKVQLLQPINVEPVSKLEDSFRLMQGGKHTGKLIVQIDAKSQVKIQPQNPSLAKLNPESTYLVVGGLGGLGRALIKVLAKMGAKYIATLSRAGADNITKKTFVKEMKDIGVDLLIYHGSVVDIKDVRRLKELTGQHPIRGIVQGAMVLQDTTMDNMTYAQWQTSIQPKVNGTMNLEAVLGDSLDFFILLSSQCGIVGSFGQGNYGAGNTFQDAFARHRASRNLPVRTIDLGAVKSEGYAAENQSATDHVMRQGISFMRLEEIFALMNHAILNPTPDDIAGSQVLVGTLREDPASQTEKSLAQRPDPRFSHIWITRSHQDLSMAKSGEVDVRGALRAADTKLVAIEAVRAAIVAKLSRLLAMPAEEIRSDHSVSSYGADSLIAVELRNWVSKQLEAHVQIFELMSALTIQDLGKLIAERSRLVSGELFASKG